VGKHLDDYSLRVITASGTDTQLNTKTPFAQARSAQAQTASLDQISTAGRDEAAPAKFLITAPSQAIIRRGQ